MTRAERRPGRPLPYLRRVGHVCLAVQDLGRATEFYTRACNLIPVDTTQQPLLLRSGHVHHCLALQPATEPGLLHIGFETLDDQLTERLWAELEARGVSTREAPPEEGRLGLAFQFCDPEGNWVEVYRSLARLPGPLTNGPFDIEKIGHFTLLAKDLWRQMEFYRDIGFQVSDRSPGGVFLRCNADHHGLAFLPSDRSTLHHHAYDVGDWEQIKLVLDWLGRLGVAPDAGPVRHGPGNNSRSTSKTPMASGSSSTARWSRSKMTRTTSGSTTRRSISGCASPLRRVSMTEEGTFPARLRRLGHVGIWARDPVGLADWYRDVLGFRVTDVRKDYEHWGAKGTAVFLRVGNDHHDLVLFPRPADVSDEIFSAFNRLSHIAYELGSLEDLFRLKAYFTERNVTIVRGVGRLFPGGNYNLDVLDAEGNRVELFYDIEQIGWDGRARPSHQWLPYRVFENIDEARAAHVVAGRDS